VLAVAIVSAGPAARLLAAAPAPAAGPACAPLALRLSADGLPQGGVLRVEASAAEGGEVSGTWAGRPLRFWREADGRWRAFLGADVARATGPSTLSLRAGGVTCAHSVEVADGRFVVRRLTVDRKYVDLSRKDLARSREETKRLEALFAKVTPERYWDGPFRLPVAADPASGRNFGQRRILNGQPRSPHAGVDFDAATGTPVVAPQAGRIVLVEPLFFSGLTVVVDHGLGLYSYYAHLSRAAVTVGDRVALGTRLGDVGATGRVTGPHLHWSVRLDGARVDPRALVRASDGS
jgi:hypothetical protein